MSTKASSKLRDKNIETMTSQKWRNERNAHKDTKALLRTAELQHKDDLDIIATLTQENLELGKRVKDLQARFEKGGVVYTINNGYVSSAVCIREYSEYTYDQPIPSEIGTKLYAKIPFYKIVNRQLEIDETQYKKYKGVLL
jgi:hypothetical protein